MRWLDSKGLLTGSMLDYGCGRGLDAETYGMDKYDPYYTEGRILTQDNNAAHQRYDVITCNYVLNVVADKEERANIIESIKSLLNVGGVAYITVRMDKQVVNGYTSTGTYQEKVILDLPVMREAKNKYTMYKLQG
jgi:hypothetical protein